MLTTIGKCLAVLSAVLALAFAGFVLISVAGGPNWQAKAANLPEYRFDLSEGESPQWSAKHRTTDASVGSPAPTLPQKLINALDDKQQRQRAELQEIEAALQGGQGQGSLEQRIAQARQAIDADIKALAEYERQLAAELERVQVAIEAVSQQVVQKTQEEFAKRKEASERREDMYRLRNQLEEINADIHRTRAQQDKLRDLLNRTYGNIGRLERRKNQLENRTPGAPYDEPAAAAAAAGATSN
ncbi:MAG TPA: hypothetical protein VML55_01480 [Planctomycetaceae bacterium]|nr:hypothetical protein [Planctomycetaceae bacterium]